MVFTAPPQHSQQTASALGLIAALAISYFQGIFLLNKNNKAGFVPKAIADTIIEQVYEAVRKTKYSNRIIDSLDDVKYVMYYNLTHR